MTRRCLEFLNWGGLIHRTAPDHGQSTLEIEKIWCFHATSLLELGKTDDTGLWGDQYVFGFTSHYQLSDSVGLDFECAYLDSAFSELVDGSIEIPGMLDEVVSVGLSYQPNDCFFVHLPGRQFSDYPIGGELRAVVRPTSVLGLT